MAGNAPAKRKAPDLLEHIENDKSLNAAQYRKIKTAQRLMNRLYSGLSDKALTWMEKEIDSDGPNAFQAAKTLLEYTLGKPKQQVHVEARHQHAHQHHLDALKNVTMKQIEAGRVRVSDVIEHKPLKTKDNSGGDT